MTVAKPGQEQRLGFRHQVGTVERRRVPGHAAALQPEFPLAHFEDHVLRKCAFLRTAHLLAAKVFFTAVSYPSDNQRFKAPRGAFFLMSFMAMVFSFLMPWQYL